MDPSKERAVETIRLDVAGAATRAEVAGAWLAVPTPAELWALIGARSTAALVHVVDGRSDVDPAGPARVADAVRAEGLDGAVARVRYADDTLSPRCEHPEAALYASTAPGAVLATPALFRHMAARPAHATWDEHWASDLHRVAYRSGRLAGTDEVVARVPHPAPASTLLPIERASDRPYDPDAPTVVIYGAFDASSALTFDAFSAAPGVNLRFLHLRTEGRDAWFCRASTLVVARSLVGMAMSGELGALIGAGIPVHWFLDDDFFALADEYPELAVYTAERFTDVAEDLAGLMVSMPALGAALAATLSLPPERVRVLPPRLSPGWPRSEGTGPRRGLGIIGSDFRGAGLRREVTPALAARGGDVPIFTTEGMRPFLGELHATFVPRQPDFLHFLHVWTRLSLAALLHPPGETRNLANKADSAIMLAYLMGAVPILAPEPAFVGWGEHEGVLKAGPGDWPAAIARALDPVEGAMLRGRLAAALAGRRRLGTDAGILLEALGRPAPVSPALAEERLGRLHRPGPPPATTRTGVELGLDPLPEVLASGLVRITGRYDGGVDLPLVTVNGNPAPVFAVPGRRSPGGGGSSMFEAFVDCRRVAAAGDRIEAVAALAGARATVAARFVPAARAHPAGALTVFLHLPKTAGTTLRCALEAADAAEARRRLLVMYEESPHFRDHLLAQLSPDTLAEFDFLYGHLDTSVANTIARVDPEREVRFVAVLREPRAFLLSYFFYGRDRIEAMRGHDLFSFLATPNRVIDNLFCRLIVGRPVTKVDEAYLEEAKEMLWRRFLFVGASEDLPHTLRRVGALTGYDLSPAIGLRANVTPEAAERHAVDPRRLVDAAEPLVRHDRQLCAYARRLFP